jgi:hypothetical protein
MALQLNVTRLPFVSTPRPLAKTALRWLRISLRSGLLCLGLTPSASLHAAPADEIAALIAAAQGTYPASKLPIMCVAIHPTVSPSQNLALLQKIGAGCARSDIGWDWIERAGSAGAYDWQSADDLWLPLCHAGLKPIMIATYNNPLYAAGVFRPIVGSVNIAAYQNFAVAIANHYSAICPHMAVELFNEPSASNWTTTPWSGASYASMLSPVSAAIKAAQPRVTVYSGGIGMDPHDPASWITQMVGAGQRFPAVDAYALHPYVYEMPPPGTPVPEQLLIDAANFARFAGSSGQAKPIALTEYGFTAKQVNGDLARQGIYIARGMLAAIIGRYKVQTIYDLIDDGTDENNPENTFGLFRNGAAKIPYDMKPAGIAFRTIVEAMAKAKTFTVSFDAAISAPMVSFDKENGQTLVTWTYDASGPKSYKRPIGSFRKVSCQDVLGKIYPCSYADGILSMPLSEASGPIIVTAQK